MQVFYLNIFVSYRTNEKTVENFIYKWYNTDIKKSSSRNLRRKTVVTIESYCKKYDNEIISLILNIQNNEAKINLSLEEQPDLKNIAMSYQAQGGEFWTATDDGKVIGTIGLMMREDGCAILKKFFVESSYRSQKTGLKLYQSLLEFAYKKNIRHIILDTPSVAKASHRFYERAGFRKVNANELPIEYTYPDRDSILYILDL